MKKKVIRILIISITIIGIYILTLFLLKWNSGINKCNEFGDYIGGVLNPLFTMLSTVAIIFLTYILGKNEDLKAEKSIETQKRITLNQMRQDALNRLSDKLNLSVYDLNEMIITKPDTLGIVNDILAKNNKEKNKKNIIVWLMILSKLENFLQLKYLFKDLFERADFSKIHKALTKATMQIVEEQEKTLSIEQKSMEMYIELEQEVLTKIGNFIYNEF